MASDALLQAFDELDWGVATANLLVQLEVRVVGDIVKLTPHDVLARPTGTRSCPRESREQLSALGLALSALAWGSWSGFRRVLAEGGHGLSDGGLVLRKR